MNIDAVFGRYIAKDSAVHRMDPRAKLLLSILFMVMVFAAGSYVSLGVAALFTAGMFAFAHISLRQAFTSIAPLAILVVFTALLNIFFVQGGEVYFQLWIICISQQGLHQALFIAIRLTMLLLGVSLLTLATTTLDLTDGFERLLEPFKRFGLPAHELSMMMGIALRFLPQFAIELRTIYRAQISRGANFGKGPKGGRCHDDFAYCASVYQRVPTRRNAFFGHGRALLSWRRKPHPLKRTLFQQARYRRYRLFRNRHCSRTGDRPRLEHAAVNTKPCTSPLPHSCKSQPSKESQHASVKPQTASASSHNNI